MNAKSSLRIAVSGALAAASFAASAATEDVTVPSAPRAPAAQQARPHSHLEEKLGVRVKFAEPGAAPARKPLHNHMKEHK